MSTQREKRKRYDELLSQGLKPSVALQILESQSGDRESEEIEDGSQYDKHPVKSGYTFTGELKHLGREVGIEVGEYPKRKLKEFAEDIETDRKYRESYRKYKIGAASTRGAETEQRHHSQKIGREAHKIKLEEEHERISLAAEKAARVERAKILTRQRYTVMRPTFVHPAVYGISPQPRHYITNMWTAEAARALDPLNLYSLSKQQNAGNSNSSDMWMLLVGMPQKQVQVSEPNGQQNSTKRKTKPKRRVQNIFSGQWEWV
jgi:hypothetical protein